MSYACVRIVRSAYKPYIRDYRLADSTAVPAALVYLTNIVYCFHHCSVSLQSSAVVLVNAVVSISKIMK